MSAGRTLLVLSLTTLVVVTTVYDVGVEGHGRLIEPPSRASAWRYGFSTPPDYNDHESFCGGFTRQHNRNGGKCGVCGDPWDSDEPRAHELGGKYGQGVIVRHYEPSAVITLRVELTAAHAGYFEFRLCTNPRETTQQCLDKHVLRLARPQDNALQTQVHPTRYYPKEGSAVYEMRYKLPEGLKCNHCILQWRYIAGNNWGTCADGTGAVGCGPQEEFRACADVQIGGAEISMRPITPTRRPSYKPAYTPSLPAQPTTTQTPDETAAHTADNIWIGFIIAAVSLFFAILVVILLYLYYYQGLGKSLKNWLKLKNKNKKTPPPVKPPRVKRLTNLKGIESDLKSESIA